MHWRKSLSSAITCIIPRKKWRNDIRNFILYRDKYYIKKFFIHQNKYDYIFSLGDSCFVANALRLAGLRKFAGPFDWLCGADLDVRINLILNNFQDFLSCGGFKPHPEIPGGYINKQTELIYLHDFTPNGNFDTEFDAVSQKYDRRINRLMQALTSGRRVLFIYTSITADTQQIRHAMDSLHKKFGKNIDFLYINCAPDVKKCKIQRLGPHLFYGKTLSWDGWAHWNRKKSTRMLVTALAQFSLNDMR